MLLSLAFDISYMNSNKACDVDILAQTRTDSKLKCQLHLKSSLFWQECFKHSLKIAAKDRFCSFLYWCIPLKKYIIV